MQNGEVPKASASESQSRLDASTRHEDAIQQLEDGLSLNKEGIQKELERKRIAAERNYVSNNRNEASAKELLPLLEAEIKFLEQNPPIQRKTADGKDFVLAERIMQKRAHLLARYPNLEPPDPQKTAAFMERYKRQTYSVVERGKVSLRIPYDAENSLKQLGISITDKGEFISENGQKEIFRVMDGDQIFVSTISLPRKLVFIDIHRARPFSFSTGVNNERIEYDQERYSIGVVLGEGGELKSFYPDEKIPPRGEPDLPSREQAENVTRYVASTKKIRAPFIAMLHRYDDVPLASLTKEEVEEVIDTRKLVSKTQSDLEETIHRNGERTIYNGNRKEEWKYTSDLVMGDVMKMFEYSADDPEREWAQERYNRFVDRYNEIIFEEKGYNKLFERSGRLEQYNSFEIDEELKGLIRRANEQGYSIVSDGYPQWGLFVNKNGARVMHFNLHLPNARGNHRKDTSDKALLEEVKKYLKQEVK